MTQICKMLTFFALMLQLALSIQARLEPASAPVEEAAENDDSLYYAPPPYRDDVPYYAPSPYGDDNFPESPYPLDDIVSESEGNGQYPPSPSPSPPSPAYFPATEQDYPYNGEYPSPSPAPYIDVMAPEVDDFYDDDYSPSEAPSPTDYGVPSEASIGSVATPPPTEWEYRAEDDAYLDAEGEDEEGYGRENRRGTMGFVIGAVCLVGLGGLMCRKRKTTNQKRKHPVYLELSRSGDV
ncbi:annexin B11-like [Neltuma alba]|uniref:annexin B11-like n=1 Tax=Neltuma alba TaxID=207710 RepID=UPI0010A485D1|nr:annexin B11-like [Prosopis alba]